MTITLDFYVLRNAIFGVGLKTLRFFKQERKIMQFDETDPMVEIEAMKLIAQSLEKLEATSRIRVLNWAMERFSGQPERLTIAPRSMHSEQPRAVVPSGEFGSAAELLAAVDASSEAERALVIGYWFQVVLGQNEIESQEINTELKHQGHALSNVTRAFDSLMKQRPQLVIQLRKAGNSKQARKKYKLTIVGVQRAQRMLQDSAASGVDERLTILGKVWKWRKFS